MPDPIVIGSVGSAAITVVVDNKADLIVESSERVRYFTDAPLLAEHGFSALIQLDDSEGRILWDAGVSHVALLENLRRMGVNPASIEAIALSHGHEDHYAAMTALLLERDYPPQVQEWGPELDPSAVEAWLEEARVPLVAHPAAFRERWWRKDDDTLVGPYLPAPVGAWEALGVRLVFSEAPHQLGPGCWTTGYIPRESFETTGRSERLHYRDGAKLFPDDLEEDQAIVINVEGKGLLVLSGCAHAGIVNTVTYARKRFGVERVCAVIGGFHLAEASDEEIEKTVAYIQSLEPLLVVPGHCTGLKAARRFAQEMPEQFVEGVVGATYLL
jgi:7,8-dihydropterin-6-yl-methyl-4-(beta-D-ribofuranosyl)aminobenzene 5'-phosphate synthase